MTDAVSGRHSIAARQRRPAELAEARDGDDAAQPDEDEDIEAEAFTVEDLRAMMRTGEIIDLKTVAALTLLAPG